MSTRVLIIGAGLTGLALASGLRLRGVDPVVVEQAPVITEAGWAIGLRQRHLAALDQLGFSDRDSWPMYQASQYLLFDGQTGLLDIVRATDMPMMLARSDLQLSLLEPVDGLVRTGVRPTTVTDHGDEVDVEFDDGRQESFDVVIGADGINSWTRRHVLGGPDATYTGCAVVRFQAPVTDNLSITCLTVGDTATLAYLLVDGGRKFHGTVFLPGEADNRRELSPAQLADLFPNVAGPLRSLVNVMRSNPRSYYININQVVVERWTRNRVAIMGDAAHAMSPVLGEGAGIGFEDAALLAELLTMPHMPVPLALASYEHLRKPQAHKIQSASHAVTVAMSTTTTPSRIFDQSKSFSKDRSAAS